jgi:hypothetical protein
LFRLKVEAPMAIQKERAAGCGEPFFSREMKRDALDWRARRLWS